MFACYAPDQIISEHSLVHFLTPKFKLSDISGIEIPRGFDLRFFSPVAVLDERTVKTWRGLVQRPVQVGEVNPNFVPWDLHGYNKKNAIKNEQVKISFKIKNQGSKPTPPIRLTVPPLAMNAARFHPDDHLVVTPTTGGLIVTRYPVGYNFQVSKRHEATTVPLFTMQLSDCATVRKEYRVAAYDWDLLQDGQLLVHIHKDVLFLDFGVVLR